MGYILIIDDDAKDLENVRLLLSVSGYTAEGFNTWEEARAYFDKAPNCDLVITRAKVKEISGNDIAHYIRNSIKPQTPILAVGNVENHIADDLFNLVLRTPLKLKSLGKNVANLLAPTMHV